VADSYEGAVDNVSAISAYVNQPGGVEAPETVNWSRVRYTGYCLLVVRSEPAHHRGGTSTLTVRGLSNTGVELDRIVLARRS
jgi:hypothetical protein